MAQTQNENILILVADENEAARNVMSGILESNGLTVIQAINGGAAIKVVQEHDVDIAIISERMKPYDGFEVAKHIIVEGKNINVVMVTEDPTTDLLVQAGHHGIAQVMKKPVEADRLIQTVKRLLRRKGKSVDVLGEGHIRKYTPEELMQRALALASQNSRSGMGGPFGAVVADSEGTILGEGVNNVQLRCDPTAHAEVLAIRSATDKIDKPRLDGCMIYCSSEPTMLGQALIIGTGIKKVYFGISHSEVGTPRLQDEGIVEEISKPISQRSVPYEQLLHDEAMDIFRKWREQGAH